MSVMEVPMPDAAYFRGELAKRRLHRYEAAAAIRLNPARFSQVMNEHVPLTPELAARLHAYLQRVDAAQAAARRQRATP
jgi:plasmid maintenance system antidote protein VapI